jgi:hypothetical protein
MIHRAVTAVRLYASKMTRLRILSRFERSSRGLLEAVPKKGADQVNRIVLCWALGTQVQVPSTRWDSPPSTP